MQQEPEKRMKYVAVVGGSVSGLGKGITISSIGRLLLSGGMRVSAIKIDPYLNIDAGTMSPFEHGEVFVLDDGGEGDLDLGNYERFLSVRLTKDHNITTGKVYNEVISRERRGDYLGKTVQVVPHVTNEIQDWITRVSQMSVDGGTGPADVCLLEFGGTVGDIESGPFLEALRQFQFRVGRENICIIFVTFVPVLSGEQKTKPTQAGVRDLRAVGLTPDIIVCRSKNVLEPSVRQKISDFCHVAPSDVVSVHDVSNIYHVPLMLAEQSVHETLRKKLELGNRMRPRLDLEDWSSLAHAVDSFEDEVRIAIVGKYTGMADAYLSIIKALKHAGFKARKDVKLVWVEASNLESEGKDKDPTAYEEAWQAVRDSDGILVPGGFGNRGVEGKVLTVQYARTAKKPILGICLGFQVMVIEHARHVLGWKGANSEEFAKASVDHPAVVVFMPEIDPTTMGGNMRLGLRKTIVSESLPPTPTTASLSSSAGDGGPVKKTLAALLHDDAKEIMERHRHRYEVNPEKVSELGTAGLYFTGRDETGTRMEIVERDRDDHPFFFGTQYHPEFQSRPLQPSPPFYGLIMAASNQLHQVGSTPGPSRGRSDSMAGQVSERKRSSSSVCEEEPSNVLKRANTVDVTSFPL